VCADWRKMFTASRFILCGGHNVCAFNIRPL